MTLVLLRNADVFAPQPLGTQNLLIGGGRVLWMGQDPVDLPATLRAICQHVDLHGLRLIPGFIDAHVHVTGGGGEAGFRTRVPPVPLSRFTTAGVTTVVGLLGTDDVARGPGELLATLYALREEGLGAYGYSGGYHVPPATLTGSVRGDLVFIEALIGVGEVAISDHRSSQPTLEELLKIASECHVAGLMTGKAGILHLHLGDGPRGLALVREALEVSELPARVFNPTHVNRKRALFAEAIELARAGSTVDITAFPVDEDDDGYAADEALALYLASGARGPRDGQLGRRRLSALFRRRRPCVAHGRRFGGRLARDAARGAGARPLTRSGAAGVHVESCAPAATRNQGRHRRWQ